MSVIGDINLRVQVNGTTFCAIYIIRGSIVDVTSADFGDRSFKVELGDPHFAAAEFLRDMAEQAMSRGVVFMRDDRTLTSATRQSDV